MIYRQKNTTAIQKTDGKFCNLSKKVYYWNQLSNTIKDLGSHWVPLGPTMLVEWEDE